MGGVEQSTKGVKSYRYDEKNNKIEIALRTRKNVKPVYVSSGQLVGIDEAVDIIMKCVDK
jgi:deoxyinosine 3'endonuclease (endonuclease V)